VYLLKDTPSIFQEMFAGRTQLHAAWETLEHLEAYLLLQILNLAGKCRLCHAQPARRTPVMLLLTDCHEISQMPQLHYDTLSLLV
jgi:hypothetical protein